MIELIHLHIHKTGGRSFFPVLKSVYGDAVDGPRNRGNLFFNNPNPVPLIELIPDNKRVLFGHLEYKHVKDIAERDHPKITTWVRDPVERVISNYYFTMKKKYVESENNDQNFADDSTLLDYASNPQNINLMSYFLEGLDFEKIFFIGTLENYFEDLDILAKKLKWKSYLKGLHKNDNKEFRTNPKCATKVVTPEMREEIYNLNKRDVELYNMVLNRRLKYFERKYNYSLFGLFDSIKGYVMR